MIAMLRILQRVGISLGFIFTGILFGSVISHPSFIPYLTLRQEVFNTTCLILFTDAPISQSLPLPSLPTVCSTVEWLLPGSLIATGLLFLIVGLSRLSCFIGVINLVVFTVFYCNLYVDSSFKTYVHFLQVMTCASALLYSCLSTQMPQSQHSKRQ